ncbi:hypothetical protein OIO90_005971 [Microbotryomycetes sp. JL221]|nr:hypothetical protein OIO90_005971 [Microbotryomycetes sp. JL221]
MRDTLALGASAVAGSSPTLGSNVPVPTTRATDSKELASIMQSIQARTTTRSTVDLAADLALSAQIGSALLEDKSALERKLQQAEQGNQKLLDKLALSVKEASQLQRRLEETVSNLEQADHNNRTLLVTLEEDRKTISRLSSDAAKLVHTSTQLKSITRAHEDLKQELISERKRSTALESRLRKQTERAADLEQRWRRATNDLEEMRQDKVLRSRKSHDALAKYRAKYSSGSPAVIMSQGLEALAQNPEAAELLKLVETLVSENDLLRSESQELHELLDVSRDQQVDQADRHAFADAEDDSTAQAPTQLGSNLLAEVLNSPSVVTSMSHATSDMDDSQQLSPGSTAATSAPAYWAANSSMVSHSQRSINLSRTLSSGSAASNEGSGFVYQTATDSRKTARRSSGHFAAAPSALGPPISSTRIPVGKGHNRRSMSIDVTSVRSLDVNDSTGQGAESLPVSPLALSTPRPPSLFSIGSEGDDVPHSRPRRHHRPLSLSLGTSVFPLVPEDEQASMSIFNSPRYPVGKQSSNVATGASASSLPHSSSGEASIASGPSGLSLHSPQKRVRLDSTYETRPVTTIDSATQTSPVHVAHDPSLPTMSTPKQASSSVRSLSPQPEVTRSHTSLSELSDPDRFMDLTNAANGTHESRTLSLSKLIDHASKLLSRIQSSDIASQEKRLKKQHLSGDIGDIENLRHHFRRVLESERAVLRNVEPNAHAHESLVLRRDFVALVKLFRDILFEMSRLRMLVNRVEVDPHIAHSLRALDIQNTSNADAANKAQPAVSASGGAGLLAPLTRFFGAALSAQPEAIGPNSQTEFKPAPPRRTVSSAISSTAVSVEFGSGAVRRAIANENEPPRTFMTDSTAPSQPLSLGRKNGQQARQDLNSIFAGAPTSVVNKPVAPVHASWFSRAAPSSNPIGRLLASYRPAPESTANAIIDSIPHAPSSLSTTVQPTLLENQLRRRGLSDSSIRSTFVAHANPHHRVISPATLALSGESHSTSAVPILVRTSSEDDSARQEPTDHAEDGHVFSPDLKLVSSARHQLSASLLATSTLSKRASVAQLRSKKSTPQLRSVSATRSDTAVSPPPVPVVPANLQRGEEITDKGIVARDMVTTQSSALPTASAVAIPQSMSTPASTVPMSSSMASTSLLGNLSQWASSRTSLNIPGMSSTSVVEEQDETTTSPKSRVGSPSNLSRSASGRAGTFVGPVERSGRDY